MAQADLHSDKVLIDEPFLTAYLGALLKATPPMELDVPPAWATAQEPVGFTSVQFGRRTEGTHAEQQALIEALRKENDQLKFNAELAKIDVEVLRSENQRLNSELSTLKGTLGNTQTAFKELRERHKNLQTELEPLKTTVITLQSELQTRIEHQAEQSAALVLAALQRATTSEAVCIVPSADTSKIPNESRQEKTRISNEERQVVLGSLLHEQRAKSQLCEQPPPPQPTARDKAASERAEARRKLEIIAQSVAENTRTRKPNQPGSRILKPANPQLKIVVSDAPEPPQVSTTILQTAPQPLPAAIQTHAADITPADNSSSATESRAPLNPNEIKLEQLPPTRTDKRKNADNYLQMQQEAEEVVVPKGYSITVT